ncbi:MAG: hypothetical protein ACKVW3_01820 [Phycisphaerales bacterium]
MSAPLLALLAQFPPPSPSDLRDAGWDAGRHALAAGWTPSALRDAGWTPSDMRDAGWTPSDLRAAGWTPSDLRAAGWTPSDLRDAGWTPSDLRDAGWTPSDMRAAGWTPSDLRAADPDLARLADALPVLENPYSRLWEDIQAKRRAHDQLQFGPYSDPGENVCGTAMCTAGHLVHMAGEPGYAIVQQYGFMVAATLIAERAHPGWPQQNYGVIRQDLAIAFIEAMAAREKEQP